MGRRNLQVFGASFLDLLAGALGAVIILYIIVPKLTQEDADALEQLQSLSVELGDLERILEEYERSVPAEVFEEIRARFEQLEGQIRQLENTIRTMQEQLARTRELERQLEQAQDRLAAAERQIEQAQAQAQAAREALAAANARLEQQRMKHLDMLIVIDITASMGVAVDGLKREIGDIVRILEHISPTLGFGIIAFGDRMFQQPVTEFPIVDVGSADGRRRLFRFIEGMHLEMGRGTGRNPEIPEATHLAMRAALNARWRSESEQRYIVLITDAPGYPEELENIYSMARNFGSRPNHTISTVHIPDRRVYSEVQTMLRRIAREGNGNYVDTSAGESFIASFLIAILDAS